MNEPQRSQEPDPQHDRVELLEEPYDVAGNPLGRKARGPQQLEPALSFPG